MTSAVIDKAVELFRGNLERNKANILAAIQAAEGDEVAL